MFDNQNEYAPEVDLEDYRYVGELSDFTFEETPKKENWQWCNETFINPLYASGKRYKFRLRCGNTRKCERCRNDMIKKLTKEMRVGVPLYCHLISDDASVWNNWRMWFSRNRNELDRYWRYPLKDGSYMVVSTLKRYRDVPVLANLEDQIERWVRDRGDIGRISRSESPVNCSNPSCRILFLPRKGVCPECGTKYIPETEIRTDRPIAIPKLTPIEQKFFDEILSYGGYKDGEWNTSPKALNGMTLEQYVSSVVIESKKRATNFLNEQNVTPDT